MEDIVRNYFIVFLLGLGTMITFHNVVLSGKKYLTRNYGKVSDMLRVVCNNGNLWRFLLSVGYFMAPTSVSDSSCKALGYLYLIGYHVFHISLLSFLSWTLYRMSYNKKDFWINAVFLLIQTSLIIPEMIFAKPASATTWDMNPFTKELFQLSYCELNFTPDHHRSWTMIIMGFVIEFYIIVRLLYIAKNRRNSVKDAPTTTTNNGTTTTTTTSTTQNVVAARRPLDLPIIYWSLALAMLTFMSIWISSSLDEKPDRIMLLNRDINMFGLFYKNLLYIVISYVITYLDIEKRKNVIFYNCGGQNGNDNSNKLDGEAWVICSKKEKKKDSDEVEKNDVSTQV